MKEDLSCSASSINHIKFSCVLKKRENDILLEMYNLNDILRMSDIQDFIHQQEVRNLLKTFAIGRGIHLFSGLFKTRNSEKVSITAEFYVSPWDSKLNCKTFWIDRYFTKYTSRIKFSSDEDEFEVQVESFTTENIDILKELIKKNAKTGEMIVYPVSIRKLMQTKCYKLQPRYEILESLCLKALLYDDPSKMQKIIKDIAISFLIIPDVNKVLDLPPEWPGLRKEIDQESSHDMTSMCYNSVLVRNVAPICYNPVRNVVPICYNPVNYNVSSPMLSPPKGYLGIN